MVSSYNTMVILNNISFSCVEKSAQILSKAVFRTTASIALPKKKSAQIVSKAVFRTNVSIALPKKKSAQIVSKAVFRTNTSIALPKKKSAQIASKAAASPLLYRKRISKIEIPEKYSPTYMYDVAIARKKECFCIA